MPPNAFDDCEPVWRRRSVLALGIATGVPTVLVLVAALTGWGLSIDGTWERPRLPLEGLQAPDSHAIEALTLPERDSGDRFRHSVPPSATRHPLVVFAGALTVLAIGAAVLGHRRRDHGVEPLAWMSGSLSLVLGTWLSVSTARWAEIYHSPEAVFLRAPEHALFLRRVAPWLIGLGAVAIVRVLWTRRDGLGMALAGLVMPLHGVVLMDYVHFAQGHLVAPYGTQSVELPTMPRAWMVKPAFFEVARVQVAGTGPHTRLTIDFAPASFNFDRAAYSGSLEGEWREPLQRTLARFGTNPRDSEGMEPPNLGDDVGFTVQLAVDRDLPYGRLVPLLRGLAEADVGALRVVAEGLGTPGTRNTVLAYLETQPAFRPDEPLVPVHLALTGEGVLLTTRGDNDSSLADLAEGARLFERVETHWPSGRPRKKPRIRQRDYPLDVELHVADDVPWQHVAQIMSELMTVVLVTDESGENQK